MTAAAGDRLPEPGSVMQRDWRRISARVRKGEPWQLLAQQSAAEVARRTALCPKVHYPDDLPIAAALPEIRRLLSQHQVVIVAGETGSGKTTQLPKLCMDAGFGRRGMIAHTQPRRIAARAVAARIAEELQVPLGQQVGYAVRFADQSGPDTLVKLMTDGLLLTEIRTDRHLDRYEVIIIDEAHERSLNIDFLLGLMKRLLDVRPDLKVIVTSATIDVDAFSRFFGGAPIVEVEGRSYPVDVRYQPTEAPLPDAVCGALEQIEKIGVTRARDVLVFHSGEAEIMAVARHLRRTLGDRWDILPLYARLSVAEQMKVFKPASRRRVVLTTNVAETSLTVPNVGFVIDPGFARTSRYSYRSKLQRLPVEPISQASAAQRAGRAGRVAPGVCFRLFDEDDFCGRPEFTDPEIKRTNLASVILQMHDLKLGKPTQFPFVDPPEPRAFTDGERLLSELGALDGATLTDIGRTMSRLPVDPRLARMLIGASSHGSLTEVLIIASALAVQDPRERPLEKRDAADQKHRPFTDKRSDFLFFVNLWRWLAEQKSALTARRLQRLLKSQFLAPNRVREWQSLHRQLKPLCRTLGLRFNDVPSDYASIHKALLAGSLSLIGNFDERGRYLGARQTGFRIFPGSALYGSNPRWVIASEIVETSQVYARCVATVEPGWIEAAAGPLLRVTHSEPHWGAKRGETFAFEAVTLYGLRLVDKRRVAYSRIDPAVARQVFIRDGLVAGAVRERFAFLTANQELIAGVRDLEAKGRRRDLLVSEDVLCAFYDSRLPPNVCNVSQLKRALNRNLDHATLTMTLADIRNQPNLTMAEADYPGALALRDARFDLKYRFAPGEPDDGVSLLVPVGMLPAVVQEPIDWLVPGLFPALCEALIRGLPKNLRRRLAPIPDAVQQLLPALLAPTIYRKRRLLPVLAAQISAEFGVDVPAEAWPLERLDANMRMNVVVTDERGGVVAQGRDVAALKARLKDHFSERMDRHPGHALQTGNLAAFPDELPGTLVARGVVAYPALKATETGVDLVLLDDQAAQQRENRAGFVQLAVSGCRREARDLARRVQQETTMGLHYASLGSQEHLTDQIRHAVFWHVMFDDDGLPERRVDFEARLASRKGGIHQALEALLPWAREALDGRFAAGRLMDDLTSPAFEASVADARRHLERLVGPDFLTRTPWARLADLPRYVGAVLHRVGNLAGRVDKDLKLIGEIRPLEDRFDRVIDRLGEWDPESLRLRFLIEELRLATFAQVLKPREKVSVKRVDTQLSVPEAELGLR